MDFTRVPFFIEGCNEQALAVAQSIAGSLSTDVRELSSSDRKYLHLSAVFACNFANHCYALSAQILEKHGLPFQVMLPLIAETAEKVRSLHPREAQTGPAVRYDENVMEAQKQLLADEPLMREVYDIMSKSIHESMLKVL